MKNADRRISNSKFDILLYLGMILFLLAIFTSGCDTAQKTNLERNYYYLNPQKKLSSIGRVVIVELENESSYTQISADVTRTLCQALQKKQVFGLTVVQRHDPSWRSLRLEEDSTYNLNQILSIRKTLKCDGLLLGTITEFRPYPHMSIGLRLRLLDLTDGQLIWALEQVWDSTDKTTQKRIKNYFKSSKGSHLSPLHEQLATMSPLEFIKFVSYEVAETFIDTYSKVAFVKLYVRMNAFVAADILNDRVLPFFETQGVPLLQILTDRGTEYCGKQEHHEYQLYLGIENIDHSKTKARSPQSNGICERFRKTVLDESYRIAFRRKIYNTLDELQADLDTWIMHYNEDRVHSGKYCFGKTPMQTFLDSIPLVKRKKTEQQRTGNGCLFVRLSPIYYTY